VKNVVELFAVRSQLVNRTKIPNKILGLVPTMGFLHEAHLSLVRLARHQCGVVGVSLFVNPLQFSTPAEYESFPRNFERDFALLHKEKVDFAYMPSKADLFPAGYKTRINLFGLEETYEGKVQPEFYHGAATVNAKLFNIVQPQKAYFGQKDGMNCIMMKRMVKDLNFPVDVVVGSTVRNADGLAKGNKNSKLSLEERKVAPLLYKALASARLAYDMDKERDATILIQKAKDVLATRLSITIEYIDLVDIESGKSINKVGSTGAMLMGAIMLGKTRLVDNVVLRAIPT